MQMATLIFPLFSGFHVLLWFEIPNVFILYAFHMHSVCLIAELWKIQEHFEENNSQFCYSVRTIFIFWCYHVDSVWVCTDLYNSSSQTQVNWLFSFMLFLEHPFCIVWQFNIPFIDTLMAVYPSSWCGLSFSNWNIWSLNVFLLIIHKK